MNFYQLQRKLREGNTFTPVCHSVHGVFEGCLPQGTTRASGFWGVSLGQGFFSASGLEVSASGLGVSTPPTPAHIPEHTTLLDTPLDTPLDTHPLNIHTPLDTHTHTSRHNPPVRDIRWSGRYASYWKAFLYYVKFVWLNERYEKNSMLFYLYQNMTFR